MKKLFFAGTVFCRAEAPTKEAFRVFTPEEQKSLDEIAKTFSIMAKDGIRMEICLVAANIFGADPGSFLPGINPVPNGWVSLIGYETKGYSPVPAY